MRQQSIDGVEFVRVGGFKTACLGRDGLVDLVLGTVAERVPGTPAKTMFDINGHGLALAFWDKSYHHDLLQADLIHADGEPFVMASKALTKSPIPERSATTDMFHDLSKAGVEHGLKFYMLGGTEDVNARCAQHMLAAYPGLQITGRRDGYFSAADEAAICEEINASGADVVWVGLGKPLEQAFCLRNRERLNATWLITCGGCFNYVTGDYVRAPMWMQQRGLEWAHRFATQPRKLGWRYLTTSPLALLLLLARTGEYREA
ncbi:WecB/TagA/CpsF family glycosyltransferase [Aureimonas sp. ME7]|uniref:WecB/TagA/CpsF family glycosyltransferase n=1 Tax=Aureimonas sp. ME7 TaxID=2744252 RepID=UPI0015FD2A79|nr:WecB/TagA/CpsF family glycosyltransferase [Aureimonas sp. ME7]